MTKIAIFIKTLLKEQTIHNCVRSIKEYLSNFDYRIYIADDGPISPSKQNLYEQLRSEGHVILELPHNIGTSASRNALLKELNEENFILRMDDDFEVSEETNLTKMLNVLNFRNDIGVIADLERQIGKGKSLRSGRISPWQGFLIEKRNYLIKKMQPLKSFYFETSFGTFFAKCDSTRNMLLIKREVFEDISWDDNLPFATEHLDFLLQLQRSNWDVAFTPDSIHLHRDDLNNTDAFNLQKKYNNFRNNNSSIDVYYSYFLKKWNLKGVKIKRNFEIYYEKLLSIL